MVGFARHSCCECCRIANPVVPPERRRGRQLQPALNVEYGLAVSALAKHRLGQLPTTPGVVRISLSIVGEFSNRFLVLTIPNLLAQLSKAAPNFPRA